MTNPWEILPLGPGLEPARAGAKAARLGQALATGLPVPPGFVLPGMTLARLRGIRAGRSEGTAVGAATGEVAALTAALEARLPSLGPPPYVVRTSSPEEDGAAVTLAGVYLTELGLTSASEILAAAARCQARLSHPTVTALRSALGLAGPPPEAALLVQSQVTAALAGVLFTRDPSEGPSSSTLVAEWVEGSTTAVTSGLQPGKVLRWRRGEALPEGDGELDSARGPLAGRSTAWLADRLGQLAEAAEALLGAGADLEWALTAQGRLWLLQLRPITAYAPRLQRPQRPVTPSGEALWRLDLEHNPFPLSPLHASLVTHLDARLDLPFRMRVEEGYLVTAPRSGRPLSGAAPEDPPLGELEAWWAEEGSPSLEALLRPLEESAARGDSLPALLPAFERIYLRYAGEIGPILARARSRLGAPLRSVASSAPDTARLEEKSSEAKLEESLAGVVPPLSAWLRRLASRVRSDSDLTPHLARGEAPPGDAPGAQAFEALLAEALRAVGSLPDRWDLASSTLAERPEILRAGAARLAALAPLVPRALRPTDAGRARSPLEQLLQIEEDDDLAFSRALAALRRAALADGERLAARGQLEVPEDVFHLDLGDLEEALARPGHRPAIAAARRKGEEASNAGPPPDSPGLRILWGVGCGGGVVEGLVVHLGTLQNHFSPVDVAPAEEPRILVCEALIPTAAAHLASRGVSAVITDQGGLLSHGAILARELGIPAVLGTMEATARLHEGARVRVDADLGLVCWPDGT